MKKIKRVMLAYPNQRWQKFDLTTTWNLSPYALCLLAAMLRDKYEVKIIDAQFYNLPLEKFREAVSEFRPDCVGLSLLTSEYAAALDMGAQAVKQVSRDITVIAGGVHVTTQYGRVMRNQSIDYCVRGEGERVLRQLLDYLNAEGPLPGRGLVYRNAAGAVEALPPDLVADLDSLPLPDYDLVDYPAYANTRPRYGVDASSVYPYARILTSRGCPVGCSFCQVKNISGRRWRRRSPGKIIDELSILRDRYGIRGFFIEDDNAFVDKERTKQMLRLLRERDFGLKWKVPGVPFFGVDEEILDLMAQTGCQMICLPVESGSRRILEEIINKPVDLAAVPRVIKAAKARGIFVAANFIIGFPGETWDEIRQTISYAEHCGADYCKIYAAQPLVGTQLYEIAKKMGCIVGDELSVNWRYGRIRSEHFSPKDISILRVYEWDRINFSDPEKLKKTAGIMGISVEELNRIRKETRDSLDFGNLCITA